MRLPVFASETRCVNGKQTRQRKPSPLLSLSSSPSHTDVVEQTLVARFFRRRERVSEGKRRKGKEREDELVHHNVPLCRQEERERVREEEESEGVLVEY